MDSEKLETVDDKITTKNNPKKIRSLREKMRAKKKEEEDKMKEKEKKEMKVNEVKVKEEKVEKEEEEKQENVDAGQSGPGSGRMGKPVSPFGVCLKAYREGDLPQPVPVDGRHAQRLRRGLAGLHGAAHGGAPDGRNGLLFQLFRQQFGFTAASLGQAVYRIVRIAVPDDQNSHITSE